MADVLQVFPTEPYLLTKTGMFEPYTAHVLWVCAIVATQSLTATDSLE